MTIQPKEPLHAMFQITLYDAKGGHGSFTAGFENGLYQESEITGSLYGHTERADIVDTSNAMRKLSIDGNGWRDLDFSGELQQFLEQVMLGDTDPDDFLIRLASEVSPGEEPGEIIH